MLIIGPGLLVFISKFENTGDENYATGILC